MLIGFFIGKDAERKIIKLTKRNELIRKSITGHCDETLKTIKDKVDRILNSGTYLVYIDAEQIIKTIASLQNDLQLLAENKAMNEAFISSRQKQAEKNFETIINYNEEFVEQRKKEYNYLWTKNHLSLDDEQQTAIVTDDKYNLVVAGAGSGKTEALITRIAYLIERKPDGIKPNHILAIAYQNKDVKEIEQRLRQRYNIKNVNVKTFHKLGKDIIEEIGNKFKHTDIINENKKHKIIKSIVKQKAETQPEYYKLFLRYAKTLRDTEHQEEEQEAKELHLAYIQKQDYLCMNHTRVNSLAEKEILDFFLTNRLNGKPITIKYEPDIAAFRPDFYLPEYDLFIEHWGLKENGQVPEWFNQTTEEYKKSMQTKKEWFAEHNKLLVDTYAYEYDEENPEKFIELLKSRVTEKLKTRHKSEFKFSPIPYNEIIELAWGLYNDPTDEISNFIENAKVCGLTPQRVIDRLHDCRWTRKQLAFGNLAVKIYQDYEDLLQKHRKIDFEDMINKAVKQLEANQNLYANIYDHILIDEYQDISAQRYKLIKALLERNPKCKLFCVGDDWQSIMGFVGSNLNFFVNFDQYFENPAISKISTNYRSIKSIVDAGAALIKNNGHSQISKAALSNRPEIKPIKIFSSRHRENYRDRYYEQTAEDCLNRIIEHIKNGYQPQDILILTRFMRTRIGHKHKYFPIVKAFLDKAEEKDIDITVDKAQAQSKVRLLTAHKGKGLEAKIVFILNVIKDTYGFPCEIEDSSIYEPARENYPKQNLREEERRLFYVAMTRAKEDLIIYTQEQSKSDFIKEIEKHTTETQLYY